MVVVLVMSNSLIRRVSCIFMHRSLLSFNSTLWISELSDTFTGFVARHLLQCDVYFALVTVYRWIKDRALCRLWGNLEKSWHHYRRQSTALADTSVAYGYRRLRKLDHEEIRWREIGNIWGEITETIFAISMAGKEDKFVGLGAGRCQQMFTSKREKQKVEIFWSHHARRRQISRKGAQKSQRTAWE